MLDRDDVATKLLLRGISQVKDGDDKEVPFVSRRMSCC